MNAGVGGIRMKRLLGSVLVLAALCACTEKEAPKISSGPVDAGMAELAEKEPNEGPDQALTLSGDSIVNAALSAEAARPDEDWYALTSSVPRLVDLKVSGVSGVDIVVALYDRDRNPLASVNSEGEGGPERFPNLFVSDRVLVKVSAVKKGTGGAYTVTARYSDATGDAEHEPNERAVDATPLPLGQPVRGFIGHSGDEDWYRIELPQALTDGVDAGNALPPPEPAAAAEANLAGDSEEVAPSAARGPLAALATARQQPSAEARVRRRGARAAGDDAPRRADRRSRGAGPDPVADRSRSHLVRREERRRRGAHAAQRGRPGEGPGRVPGGEERLDRHGQGRPARLRRGSALSLDGRRGAGGRERGDRTERSACEGDAAPRATASAKASSRRRATRTCTCCARIARCWRGSRSPGWIRWISSSRCYG